MTSTEIASASKIMLGTTEATAMYIGSTLIWTATPIVPYDAEIEYLESTGTQYINTGVIASPGGISFEVDCTIENNSGSSVYTVGGLHYIYLSSNNGIRTGGTNNAIAYTPGNRVTITASYDSLNRRIITIGDNVLTGTAYNAASGEFVLLRIPNEPNCIGKLYSTKVYLNSTLVRDMVPVRIKLVGYMYDKVSGLLYGNNGTGSFTLGPDIVEIEYLEATGTQYIDTNTIYNGNYRAEVKFLCNSLASPEDSYSASIFGARQDPNTNSFQLSTFSNGCFAYNGLYTYVGISTNTEYVAEFRRDNKLYINGVEKKSVNNLSFNTPSSILLFALHQNSNVTEKFIGKIYYFKMYDGNDNTILDLIPVRVGQTGYMYDKVSGQLLGNSGTGSFILGRDELPTGYTELEYISSSSGGNQYIDLGIKLYETLNTDYDIAMKFNIASGNANQAAIFACQDSDNDPWPGTFVRTNSSSGKAIGRYIGGTAKDNTLGDLGADIELPVQTSPNKNVTSLNNNNTTHQYGTSLFCAFVGGTNTPARYCNAKLYYFKLFVGGTLVRDLIPCKNSNNVVGMYDVVNNVFYTSPNGNAFVAGPAV